MMRDTDLEHLLRRYRPADPPPDLRARVLSSSAARIWPWAAAAAALLAVSLGVGRLNDHLIASAGLVPAPDPIVQAAEELAEALGGGEEGRAAAALLLAEGRWRAELRAMEAEAMPTFPGAIR